MRQPIPFWIILLIGLISLIILFSAIPHSSANMNEIQNFLEMDSTNTNKYKPWYTCGHFARDLSRNASKLDIEIGSAIVGNHPTFRGHNSHILNYFYINNNTIIFLEAETETFMYLSDVLFQWEYIRLYPDGTQVPSYRKYNLAPTIRG